jgi:predicted AAA+ superfamily ATPase
MERKLMQKLESWHIDGERMPLLLSGARQVGKSYLLQEFGERFYENVVHLNLETEVGAAAAFDGDLLPRTIISILELHSGQHIVPEKTLLILDEIQACPRALTALKSFCENAPEYHVVAAGSLLGVALMRGGMSFPVGKVKELTLYPLDFEEFLWAMNKRPLTEMIRAGFKADEPLTDALHKMALKCYQQYLVIGGMPAVVATYLRTQSYLDVNQNQGLIYNQYVADMAKYPDDFKTMRIRACYDSVPSQLAKENKKFQYKAVKSGTTSSYFEESIEWLRYAGIALKCVRVKSGNMPVSVYAEPDFFKLYLSDVGLLTYKSGISASLLLGDIGFDNEFVGGLVENYVAQQLTALGYPLYYWSSEGKAEVDFVIQMDNRVVPIEVKKSLRTQSKSLNVFVQTYHKDFSIRISAKTFGFANHIKSVPLYAVFCM